MRVNASHSGLRSAALVAVAFGVVGSIGLLRRVQQHPPPLIVVLFVIWVAAPFVLLGVANIFSNRWPSVLGNTLYVVTLCVTVVSLAIYVDDNIAHRTAHPAFVWVAVPPASIVVSAIALGIGAMRKKKSRNGGLNLL
jgi:hypothetical protein